MCVGVCACVGEFCYQTPPEKQHEVREGPGKSIFVTLRFNKMCIYSVLQCVAVCCSVLQCVAVCCSVLQCVAVCEGLPEVCKGPATAFW